MNTIDRNLSLIDSLSGRVTTGAVQVMAWDEPGIPTAASLMLANMAIVHSVDDAQVAMLEEALTPAEIAYLDKIEAEIVSDDLERSRDNRARAWLASLPAAQA